MLVMRRASVRELHIHTSELVREASDGGTILIERRGEAVAEFAPSALYGVCLPVRKRASSTPCGKSGLKCRRSVTVRKSSKRMEVVRRKSEKPERL
jgi:antitoxin (DNA-binding transcriptional repressor) of toxin-antitoxin stability system